MTYTTHELSVMVQIRASREAEFDRQTALWREVRARIDAVVSDPRYHEIMLETVGLNPDGDLTVGDDLPEIPKDKQIKRSDLPYFTRTPTNDKVLLYGEWLVVGYQDDLKPGARVVVNRGKDRQEQVAVYIEQWHYRRRSPRTGMVYVLASFRSEDND